ncbi:MAG: diguanylate cyclase [Thermodesulfobacteriota bacterium]
MPHLSPKSICLPLGVVALYVLFIVGVAYKEKSMEDLYLQGKREALQKEYLVSLEGYQRLADFIFFSLIDTPMVRETMYRAAHGDESTRKRLRKQLLQSLAAPYAHLKEQHFRQLHFHLPDCTSFLRFHRPQKFGDSLKNVRDTVAVANTTLKPVAAFEEGRILNGFRYVYPLFHRGEHVGSVEISVSFAAINSSLTHLFEKTYSFAISTAVVRETIFNEELSNYQPCRISPTLLHDREVLETLNRDPNNLPPEIVARLEKELSEKHQEGIAQRQTVSHIATIGGKGYIATMLPLKNLKGKSVAFLVSYEKDNHVVEHRKGYIATLILLSVLFAVATAFVFFIYATRERLRHCSATDFLTKTWNRRKGSEVLAQEHHRARRYGSTYSVILFDIDFFKKVNDAHGHAAGDAILVTLADLVRKRSRKSDLLCRWGGEEFLLCLPETPLDDAAQLAEILRETVAATPFGNNERLTVSCGVAEADPADASYESVLRRADAALYQAKAAGRNRVCKENRLHS